MNTPPESIAPGDPERKHSRGFMGYTEEERREANRRGGKKRAEAFDREYQQSARSHVSPEACAENGAAGAKRTIELHGLDAFRQAARKKRLLHPTKPERAMIGLLRELGQVAGRDYDREFEPFVRDEEGEEVYICVDFAWAGRSALIEVDGALHRRAAKDPEKLRKQQAWDKRKAKLLRKAGWRLLSIDDTDIDKPETRRAVARLLGIREGTP